jgi:hypothetical protein
MGMLTETVSRGGVGASLAPPLTFPALPAQKRVKKRWEEQRCVLRQAQDEEIFFVP